MQIYVASDLQGALTITYSSRMGDGNNRHKSTGTASSLSSRAKVATIGNHKHGTTLSNRRETGSKSSPIAARYNDRWNSVNILLFCVLLLGIIRRCYPEGMSDLVVQV